MKFATRLLIGLAIFALLFTGMLPPTSASAATTHIAFKDIPDKHWAKPSIDWGIDRGIVTGYQDNTFRPDKKVTQAEFLTMLIKAFQPSDYSPDPTSKPWDEPVWNYASVMNWELFDRYAELDRGQVAQLIASCLGATVDSENEAIQLLLDRKLSNGKTAATVQGYDARGSLNRAEAITFIRNFKDKVDHLSARTIIYKFSKGTFHLSTRFPKDSSFVLYGELKIDAGLMIQLTDGIKTMQVPIKVDNRNFSQRIELPSWSEFYIVNIYYLEPGDPEYRGLSDELFFISNKDPQGKLKSGHYSVSSLTTTDSQVTIRGKFDTDQSIMAFVTKDGTDYKYLLRTKDSKLNQPFYLRYGSGTYHIEFYERDPDNPSDQHYYSYGNYFFDVVNTDTRTGMEYLFPSPLVESDDPRIVELATTITRDATTDMERTTAIHDWVSLNIAYDVENYLSGNAKDFSAIETLSGKKAICNGYARLTAALNRAVGIQSRIIAGPANGGTGWEAHAWVETLIDGKWMVQDTTWDAGYVDNNDIFHFEFTREYFNPDSTIFASNHTRESILPE